MYIYYYRVGCFFIYHPGCFFIYNNSNISGRPLYRVGEHGRGVAVHGGGCHRGCQPDAGAAVVPQQPVARQVGQGRGAGKWVQHFGYYNIYTYKYNQYYIDTYNRVCTRSYWSYKVILSHTF